MSIFRECWEFQKRHPGLIVPEALIAVGMFFVGLHGGHDPVTAAALSVLIAAHMPVFGGLQVSMKKAEAVALARSKAEAAEREKREAQK